MPLDSKSLIYCYLNPHNKVLLHKSGLKEAGEEVVLPDCSINRCNPEVSMIAINLRPGSYFPCRIQAGLNHKPGMCHLVHIHAQGLCHLYHIHVEDR